MATLEIVEDVNGQQRYDLTSDEIVIGRYPFCDVVFNRNSISRQHARIVHESDGYYVEDLNSLNGTFVNGQRISARTRLQDQDKIHLYEILCVFHERSGDRPATLDPEQAATSQGLESNEPPENQPRHTNIVNTLDARGFDVAIATEQKLRAVLEINRALGSSLDVDDVLPSTLDGLFTIFPQSDRGYILFAEEPDGKLALRAIRDRAENTTISNTLGPISYAMANRVMSNGEAILSADSFNDSKFDLSESVLDFPIRSMMCAPLMGPKRKPLGIIYVDTNQPDQSFTAEDLEVLVSVAIVAGQAVEYTREHEARLNLHRQSEERLKRYATELEQRNQELQQFTHIASHDLQEPLRTIGRMSGLLKRRYEDQIDEQADEWFSMLVQAAERMQSLVRDMVTYTRVGGRSRPFTETDCNTVLSNVLENLKSSIEDSHAQVTVDKLPTVHADAPQLTQLFEHLIGNAIKFHGQQPPKVHVLAEKHESDHVFSVKDCGIGIEPEYKESIFHLFKRPHHRDEYPGTGIGLAVCQSIVHRHGGRIWFDSRPGQGSIFYFSIPANRQGRA
jgi:histidine kinase